MDKIERDIRNYNKMLSDELKGIISRERLDILRLDLEEQLKKFFSNHLLKNDFDVQTHAIKITTDLIWFEKKAIRYDEIETEINSLEMEYVTVNSLRKVDNRKTLKDLIESRTIIDEKLKNSKLRLDEINLITDNLKFSRLKRKLRKFITYLESQKNEYNLNLQFNYFDVKNHTFRLNNRSSLIDFASAFWFVNKELYTKAEITTLEKKGLFSFDNEKKWNVLRDYSKQDFKSRIINRDLALEIQSILSLELNK